jgi:YVTN family beta-propeller protein
VATANLTGALTVDTSALNIGSWNGSSEFFSGVIDEVAVYTSALSATQVTNHYSAGINTAPPPPQSQLSVSRSGAGNGTVTSTPSGINCGVTCSVGFPSGTSVTLTAAPAAGSVFTGWSGGGCSGTGTCIVSLSTNTTVNAAFAPVPTSPLSVTKSGAGAGTVTSTPSGINCGATCVANFPTGNNVTLTATASAGSQFSGWSGGGCSGTGTCIVSLSTNTTVDAGFGPAPTTGYQQVVTGDAPAGYWRLDETSGTTAANTTGAANNGTYTNVTLNQPGLLASASNRAASFSGTNSRVQIASNTAIRPTAAVTLEAWIKPTTIPASGFASVASKAESYSLQFNSGRMEFTIIQSGTRRRLQAPAGAVAVGGTYHVVGVYNGTTQSLYINGSLAASAALTGAITANNNALYIGSWNGSSEFFRGTIDEVAVYSTALTASQVTNHYTTGTTVLVALVQNAPDVRLVADGGAAHARDRRSTPVGSAFDDALHRLYVVGTLGRGLSARNGVTVFDTRTWRIVDRIRTGGSGAASIAVDPVRHLVYVTSAFFESDGVRGAVQVINGRNGRIVRSVPTGPGPKAIAVNPRTGTAYVTAATSVDGSTAVMAIERGRVVATIPIGPFERYYDNPFGLAVNPVTNTVYASNPLDGFVYVIDGASNAVVRSVGVGGEPTALAVNPKTGLVHVATARRVVAISGPTHAVARRFSVGGRPRGLAVDAARGVVYATTTRGAVVAIAGGTARVVAHAIKPNGVAVSRTGRVAVADAYRRSVAVFGRGPGTT